MHNNLAFLIFLFGLFYCGFIGFLAWLSPKGYVKLVVVWKKWIKATSIIYPEGYINFLLSPSGIGLWIIRIITIPAALFCLRGIIYGIWGK